MMSFHVLKWNFCVFNVGAQLPHFYAFISNLINLTLHLTSATRIQQQQQDPGRILIDCYTPHSFFLRTWKATSTTE